MIHDKDGRASEAIRQKYGMDNVCIVALKLESRGSSSCSENTKGLSQKSSIATGLDIPSLGNSPNCLLLALAKKEFSEIFDMVHSDGAIVVNMQHCIIKLY